jgi:hypothetical protein
MKQNDQLRRFKNVQKRYQNTGWHPGNFFPGIGRPVTKNAPGFPLAALCG